MPIWDETEARTGITHYSETHEVGAPVTGALMLAEWGFWVRFAGGADTRGECVVTWDGLSKHVGMATGEAAAQWTPSQGAVLSREVMRDDDAIQIFRYATFVFPKQARHNFAPRTNQDVINLFAKAFGGQYLNVLRRAGLYAALLDFRASVYAGPSIESLPLSDAEKAELIKFL